jgi:hypothetical protein
METEVIGEELPTYCAWCKKHMYGPTGEYSFASHAICPPCLKELEKEAQTIYPDIKFESKMSFRQFMIRKLAEHSREKNIPIITARQKRL